MKNNIKFVSAFVVFFSLFANSVWADSTSEALHSFKTAGQSSTFFDNSYGYAIFPTIGKAGFIAGGAHGSGKVYAKGALIGESTMTQVTVGLQIGGQAYSQIIFFETEDALKNFTSGNFEFNAQATAVAITAGASAETNTGGGSAAGVSGGSNNADTVSSGYRKGMAIFTIAKGGLMLEVSLGGQKYSFQSNAELAAENAEDAAEDAADAAEDAAEDAKDAADDAAEEAQDAAEDAADKAKDAADDAADKAQDAADDATDAMKDAADDATDATQSAADKAAAAAEDAKDAAADAASDAADAAKDAAEDAADAIEDAADEAADKMESVSN